MSISLRQPRGDSSAPVSLLVHDEREHFVACADREILAAVEFVSDCAVGNDFPRLACHSISPVAAFNATRLLLDRRRTPGYPPCSGGHLEFLKFPTCGST